ncbi:MAG: Acetyl-CoA carboxylase [Candidatus Gottesmanbacteria bacterium GW2011_GWA2_41_12]|uniref:Acetyl-CoA carboxylase n=1 Tax=Candidatus Gottesmanbacteria bacterium GW2011_GWA2_41_12 TaxID=1618440 RepID=A0A0G0UIJ2_9BACT|nr:MAG: Acetyl-CoA carboxylase [Candidatus Gottesmanbacteria bacterium GW2011_GWA2_41_12]
MNIRDKFNVPIFYITPDVRRAVGPEKILPDYHIICSCYHPVINVIRGRGGNVFCLEESGNSPLANSGLMLSQEMVQGYIKQKAREKVPNLVFFKPSAKIDLLCKNLGYRKLVNDYPFNEEFENKTNFYALLKECISESSIPGFIEVLAHTKWEEIVSRLNTPVVIQFGHGWAGKTTFVVNTKEEFLNLQNKFPDTAVKINQYIKGDTYLNNCVVYKDKILASPPARQITGIKELSIEPATTCGRQWVKKPDINSEQIERIRLLSVQIGLIMSKKSYQGYFGLDFIIEDDSGRIFVSENNARFTASSSFFSQIEIGQGRIPLFLYHLASFLDIDIPLQEDSSLFNAAQVDIRNISPDPVSGRKLGFGVYKIDNLEKISSSDFTDIKEGEILVNPNFIPDIKYNQEIAKLEMKENVLNQSGGLLDKYKKVVEKLRETDTRK